MTASLHKHPVILSFGLIAAFAMSNAQAGVYRCKDANGATTYSQTPCKAGETSQSMNHVQRTANPEMAEACSLARDFAGDVLTLMQSGAGSDSVIDQYGGVNYIAAPVLNIINYVSTFRLQKDTSPSKIGSLTYTKCRNGGFGKFQPQELPNYEPPMQPAMAPPPATQQPGTSSLQPAMAPPPATQQPGTPSMQPAMPLPPSVQQPATPVTTPRHQDQSTISTPEQYRDYLKKKNQRKY